MIGYLEGKLIWADQYNVIISAGGVGYEISFKNNFTVSDYGSVTRLFIVHKISEYGQTLFGFNRIEEKIIFETLDNIKGVGSKIIFTILSELEIKSFSNLQNLNLDQLVKLPGVGKSTAQKFLLGLSNKLKKEIDLEEINNSSKENIEEKYKNEIELLIEWGVKKSNLIAYMQQNLDALSGMDSKLLIQYVLKNINK